MARDLWTSEDQRDAEDAIGYALRHPNTSIDLQALNPDRAETPKQGTKHDNEKLDRFDLIPPDILLELAELYGLGAKKYDDRNWQQGFKWGRVVRALMSHLMKWLMGEKYDKENGQRHLISVIWCAIALAWFEKHNIGEDDRWQT